ncbi:MULTISPECIES: hypothetical protein [unclassified Acinetobacter]|uniref:hypothetical protein n=1 Tax=unclassified Acinetobacter TaxID=196816 RepID=UPI002934D99E|nr:MULTISPECIES: hypothetical protein [unclassified Acinetobacter]WOE31920.1 hypothetical protein QSG84_01460 [Acinetobacter sp. SAAs470]WOE37387.1 hypothetical protein QSG86_10505 [Acinetobacter sp. SAAs474]
MSDSQQQQKSNILLTTCLIVIESVFTFVLKHDQVIALQAKNFIDNKITLKINSYIPYFDFYVQFEEHGILFDIEPPAKAIDLDIRTTLMDLIQIVAFGNKRSIRTLRIDGDKILADQFKDLILLFSFPHVISDWKQWFSKQNEPEHIHSSKKRVSTLLQKIDLQRSKINTLQTELIQYKNRIRRLQRNQKRLNISFLTIIVILIALLMYTTF